MSRVSTQLNFPRCTEQAFALCRSDLVGDFNGPLHRFANAAPAAPGRPPPRPEP